MNINLLSTGDIERWIIIILILMSNYLLWSAHLYDRPLKILLTIPRTYLVIYYLLVIFDLYLVNPDLATFVRSGLGSVYGIVLLFAVEVYVRWVSRKYAMPHSQNSGNYTVTFVDDKHGVILARGITVRAVTDSKIYDATISSEGMPIIISGSLAAGDTATWKQTFDTPNVGIGKTLTPTGVIDDKPSKS